MITRLLTTCQGLPRYNLVVMAPTERKLFSTWKNIRRRCRSKICPAYKDYGARGIDIADEFYDDFGAFFEHVGAPPTMKHTLDRIENDKGYVRGNIRWATKFIQSRNRRNNVLIEWKGRIQCARDWANETGIHWTTIHARYNRGIRGAALFKKSPNRGREAVMVEIDGEIHSLSRWALLKGLRPGTVIQRYRMGKRGVDMIAPRGPQGKRAK